MSAVADVVASVLVVLGGAACLLGSLGLARLPDTFMRLHGPSKTATLGIGCVALASVSFFSAREGAFSAHELLIIVFVAMTTPVSAHLIARAAWHRRLPRWRDEDTQP